MIFSDSRIKLLNQASALLMALMLLCQFLPYWHYGEGDALSASVNGYVWFPHNHQALGEELHAADASYHINGVAYPSVLILILCVTGVILCLWKKNASLTGLIPAGCGVFGIWAYLAYPGMSSGSLYWLHLLLFALMLLSGTLMILLGVKNNRRTA